MAKQIGQKNLNWSNFELNVFDLKCVQPVLWFQHLVIIFSSTLMCTI